MVIVAGHITVEPEQGDSYVAGCRRVVEKGRQAAGCLDFAITADEHSTPAASTSSSAGNPKLR